MTFAALEDRPGNPMTPAELISLARSKGITVSASGDSLIVDRPARTPLSPELRQLLLSHKQALLEHFRKLELEPEPRVLTPPEGVLVPRPPENDRQPDPNRWSKAAAWVLSKIADRDTRAVLRDGFEERAGIVEFEGNTPRPEAERQAFIELVERAGLAADPDTRLLAAVVELGASPPNLEKP